MASPIFWTGYSGGDRHSGIENLRTIISRYGDVVGFRMFSDIAIVLEAEVPESAINTLFTELSDQVQLDRVNEIDSVSSRERTIFINITFSGATGDLVIEIPSAPG
jgi:hypothetical protein